METSGLCSRDLLLCIAGFGLEIQVAECRFKEETSFS